MRTLKLDKVILKVSTFHCTIAVFVRKIALFFAKLLSFCCVTFVNNRFILPKSSEV